MHPFTRGIVHPDDAHPSIPVPYPYPVEPVNGASGNSPPPRPVSEDCVARRGAWQITKCCPSRFHPHTDGLGSRPGGRHHGCGGPKTNEIAHSIEPKCVPGGASRRTDRDADLSAGKAALSIRH